VLGVLAVLAIPAGVAASWLSAPLGLLEALYVTVPLACALALAAWVAARRARFALARSVVPAGAGTVRAGRVLAWAGLYAGVTGALALAVYGALRWAQ
jgi:hypothetical protein